MKPGYVVIAVMLLAGAAEARPRPPVTDWRELATAGDRGRIRGWRDGWVAALARANLAHAAEVRAEGVLLSPDAALPDPRPPVGDYACRTIKLGARTAGGADWVVRPATPCRVSAEGDLLDFVKLDGAQRPSGRLYADGPARMVFLGTMVLADERRPLDYGRDDERDMIGAFERIGERRWRLVLPSPKWETLMEVIEVTPAAG